MTIQPVDGEMVRCLVHCQFCGGESILYANIDDIVRYNAGAFVQDVWPDKSLSWREAYITGTHGWCFDNAFADEED